MAVEIRNFHEDLGRRFLGEKARLEKVLPKDTIIEHVGSTAIGIGGKNIVDILVGVGRHDKTTGDRGKMTKNWNEMAEVQGEMAAVRDILTENGYIEGHDTHPDRIFMATRAGETGEGDFHVHVCPREADSYRDMILFRDYLRAHPEVAQEYVKKKHECAEKAGYDRKKYKTLKSAYVEDLLEKIKSRT